jgi:hypothetical protein
MSTPTKKTIAHMGNQLDILTSRMAGMSPFKPETTVSRRAQFKDVYRNHQPTSSSLSLPQSILDALLVQQDPRGKFFPANQKSVNRGDNESSLQAYGNKELQRECKSWQLDHHDTSSIHVLPSGSEPDNVFTPKEFFFGPSTVVFDLEWKKYPKKAALMFDAEEKGQAINYGLEFLDAQPWRKFMYVATCNLDLLQFFKVERGDHVTEFAPVKFLQGKGSALLRGFLSLSLDHMGFSLPAPFPGVEMQNWHAFEGGATSVVYRSDEKTVSV